jgi:hypothetical protein
VSLAGAVLLFGTASTWAISPNQVDDFENGTTQSWAEGGPSPNPPTNVADGGPNGAGDAYLRNASNGAPNGPGGKLVMFNSAQWGGNYNSAGVRQIEMQMANFGATTLLMRIGFQGGDGTQWVSSFRIVVPDGMWQTYVYELNLQSMTRVSGAASLDAVLANVNTMRILHNGAAAWRGDSVVGDLGLDNITASLVPVELQSFTVD